MWEGLVLDNETRWDTDLMMLERVVYFDTELLALFAREELGIPRESMLERDELDLAFGMTLLLEPFRTFTKFVQHRSKVTLGEAPRFLDALVEQLSPGRFAALLAARSLLSLPRVEVFQALLIASIRDRFGSIFSGQSLALAAAYMLPGRDRLTFRHFPLEARHAGCNSRSPPD